MANHTFISPKGNLQNLIENIYEILGKSGISGLTDNELSRLKNAVFSAEIPEDEWRPFAVFRHEGYSRNLVDHGNGNFDLLLVAWNPGQSSCIHDHAGSHCLMKILEGQIEESVYRSPDSESCAKLKHQMLLEPGESTYIHDKLGLHRIANPSQENPAVSLHLYSPPITKCKWFNETLGTAVQTEIGIDSYRGVQTTTRPSLS